MIQQPHSIFTHNFTLPEAWTAITLVQLCTDELFSKVSRRLQCFEQKIDYVLSQHSSLNLLPLRGRHSRPLKPTNSFDTYLDCKLFDGSNNVIFVFNDLDNPNKHLRGENYLDVFETIYKSRPSDNSLHAALINPAECFMTWNHFFSVGDVRLPVCGDIVSVSAWAVGQAKQRIIDLAHSASRRGPLVEVGRLFGGTAALLGLALRDSESDSAVFSFDPYPHVYNDRFLEIYGVSDDVALCDMNSEEGRRYWIDNNLPPVSFLHIDGDHAYEAVCNDVNGWYPLMAEGAVIMFDDYGYDATSLAGSTRAIYDTVISRPERFTNIESVSRALIASKREAH